MEDTVFAGACVDALKRDENAGFMDAQFTDAAEAGHLLYREHSGDLIGMLKNCYHGRYLTDIGLAADLEFCSQLDLVDVVPHQIDGQIIV